MATIVTTQSGKQATQAIVPTGRESRTYLCGFTLGYKVGDVCVRLGLVRAAQLSLHDTRMLQPHQPHLDRSVPVHPRVLKPYRVAAQQVLDRRALQRAVQCACSLPITKRTVTRLLGHSLLAELALAATALLALAALGTPVTLDDILRQLASFATLALELLLVAIVGAVAAEILLSGLAIVQAALSD